METPSGTDTILYIYGICHQNIEENVNWEIHYEKSTFITAKIGSKRKGNWGSWVKLAWV